MNRLPLTLGITAAVFWYLAFAVALGSLMHSMRTGAKPGTEWWDIGVLRDPGRWLGEHVFSTFERGPGVDYAYILGDGLPFFIGMLAITATAIGVAVWFFSQIAYSAICRRRLLGDAGSANGRA